MALQKVADKSTKSLQTSRKLSMADLLASGDLVIPKLRRGQEVRGRVVLVTPAEILVDIGAKSEGVIGGKEFDSSRDIVSAISVGQTIEATVIFVENDAGQVVLSLRKMAGESRWRTLEEKKVSGEEIEVSAVEANRGGVICDFEGIRGFLPASQLTSQGGPASQLSKTHSISPSATSSGPSGSGQAWSSLSDLIGRRLRVGVIEVDRTTNRLIFSQKKPGGRDGDLANLLKQVKIGDRYEGVATAILPFGIFVEIEVESTTSGKGTMRSTSPSATSSGPSGSGQASTTGIKRVKKARDTRDTLETRGTQKLEGLVHISEISWEKIENPPELFKVGDKVSVMVIAKDEKSARVNLSIKQLTHDPFGEVSRKFSQNQKVGGTVARVTPYGVFVQLPFGVEGLMHISKISPNVAYKVGEEVECEIETIDVATRKISLAPIAREKPILYR